GGQVGVPLRRVGGLRPGLGDAGAALAVTGAAAAAAAVAVAAVLLAAAVRAHVLGLVLRLLGVRVVGRLRLRGGIGVLGRVARTAVDVATGDRDRRVAVDRVLLAHTCREGALLDRKSVVSGLSAAGAT